MSKDYAFTDVIGLDPELLAMVPQPVVSVVLLYPLTEKVKVVCFIFVLHVYINIYRDQI